MTSDTKIRTARLSDAEKILAIYKPYVQNTAITFEIEVPSLALFRKRIINVSKTHPWLVCEIKGQIAGYAYAGLHRTRACYQWSTEASVYVHHEFRNRKIAYALYNALFDVLTAQGFRNVLAGITLPNEASIKFHEALGYILVGTYKDIGFKHGKWRNVSWYEKALTKDQLTPKVPVLFSKLNSGYEKIINTHTMLIK